MCCADRPAQLYLTLALYHRMHAHAASLPGEEVCGLLGGSGTQAVLVLPIENSLHSARAFRMAPQAQVDAFYTLAEQGVELLAIYHSHPHGSPVPSMQDTAEWAYPGVISIIWSQGQAEQGWQMRAFVQEESRWREVAWQIISSDGA